MFMKETTESPEQRNARLKKEEEAFFVELEVKIRRIRNKLYERYAHKPDKFKSVSARLSNILQQPYNFKP